MSLLGYAATGGALGAVLGSSRDKAGIGGLVGLAVGAAISSMVEPSAPANPQQPDPKPDMPNPKPPQCGWGDWLLGNCGQQPQQPANPDPDLPPAPEPQPQPDQPKPVEPKPKPDFDPNPPEDPGPNQDYFFVPEFNQAEDGWPELVAGWPQAVLTLGEYMDGKIGPYPAKNHAASSMLAKAAYAKMAALQIWPKKPWPPVNDACKNDPQQPSCVYLVTAYNYFLNHEI